MNDNEYSTLCDVNCY